MFFLDKPKQDAAFQQCTQILSNAAIERLLAHTDKLSKETALLGGGVENTKIRRSKIHFLQMSDTTRWLYEHVGGYLRDANRKHFGYDITAIQPIQYTEYHAEDEGTFHDHLDWAPGPLPRKLSMSIQLSDDADYQGGDLEIKLTSRDPYVGSRTKGDGVVFSSFLLHGVTPVTKGIRRSLVVWAVGPEFR